VGNIILSCSGLLLFPGDEGMENGELGIGNWEWGIGHELRDKGDKEEGETRERLVQ
jgi:hypothetical protein